MTSLEIMQAKKVVKDFMNSLDFPKEVERLILKEIYDEARDAALNEALAEAKAKEGENEHTDKQAV